MEVQPRKAGTKGPAEWFTSDVWIEAGGESQGPTYMTLAFVHFAPGARTAWHSHALGQTLKVTEGVERVQSRGEPIIRIHPGDVAATPRRRGALARRRTRPSHDLHLLGGGPGNVG